MSRSLDELNGKARDVACVLNGLTLAESLYVLAVHQAFITSSQLAFVTSPGAQLALIASPGAEHDI